MQEKFGVRSIKNSPKEMMAALYLQVSIVSQALIFVTRSRSWSYVERPGMLLMGAFMIAQLVRTKEKLLTNPFGGPYNIIFNCQVIHSFQIIV